MSVEFGIYIVGWEDFAGRISGGEEPFDVVEDLDQERVSIDSLDAQDAFLGCVDDLRERMPPGTASALSEVFDHLFWSWRGPEKQILDCGQPDNGIDVAWAPATAKRFAGIWRSVDLEACRTALECAKPASAWFCDPDRFISFARECGDCIDRAAREDRGLVVFVFG